MKTANSIIMGILTGFVVYSSILVFYMGKDEYTTSFVFLLMALLNSYQLGVLMKFRDLYRAEKNKNEELIKGIQETKNLINQALINKN